MDAGAPEPSGEQCPLPDSGDVVAGACYLANVEELSDFLEAGIRVVTGPLRIGPGVFLPTLDFSTLESAARVDLENNEYTERLALRSITAGDLLLSGNSRLLRIEATLLESSSVVMQRLPTLEQLDLPSLAAAEQVAVQNTSLGALHLAQLREVDSALTIEANPALQTLELPLLVSVGGALRIAGNDSLPQCTVDALMDRLAVASGLPPDVTVEGNREGCDCTTDPPSCL